MQPADCRAKSAVKKQAIYRRLFLSNLLMASRHFID